MDAHFAFVDKPLTSDSGKTLLLNRHGGRCGRPAAVITARF